MEHVEFYKRFPLLVPETLDPLKADGYIEISEGVQVRVSIDASATNGVYCVDVIKSTPEVEQFLQSKRLELDTRFQQCASGLSFAKELQHSLVGVSSDNFERMSKFYRHIVKECDEKVGWDCVESFDKKAQIMLIKLKDRSGRDHNVYVNFASNSFSSDIEENTVSMEGTKLMHYLETLKQRCEQLSECWDMLDDIDSSLCVLQPQHPKRFELWRRVAVTDLATALIDISPDRFYPKIVVYGPSSISDPLNKKAKLSRSSWSSSKSVRENIEALLQCKLPEQSSFDQKDIKLECGICFAFVSENEAADQLCTNDVCAQPFHRRCLVQWLTSKEDTRQSFTTLFGKCPYCSGNITVTSS